jgi:peroxiredoxin
VCQLAFPYLERLSAGSALQIVAVSQDDDSSTKSFNQRFGVTFPTLLDQSKENYPASNAYGISSVPSLFLVEKNGEVTKSFSGFSKRDLEAVGDRAGVKPFRAEDNVPEWKAG